MPNLLIRVLELFGDEVEEVPASEGEKARIKSNGDLRGLVVALEGVLEVLHVP